MCKTHSQDPSRRKFLHIMLGLTFGMSAVKKVYGHKQEKKKLLLTDFFVVGYRFYHDEAVEYRLKDGDLLTLKADPQNPYGEFAVEILTDDGLRMGYVPRSDNETISRLLRQGADLEAGIQKIDLEGVRWRRVKVGVFIIV